MRLFCAALLCATAAAALQSPFDGVWEVPDSRRPTGLIVELRTDGVRLTGSFTGPNGRVDIRNGSVSNGEAQFEMVITLQEREITERFTARIVNGDLVLTGEMPGLEQKMTAKRRAADAGPPDWFSAPDAPQDVAAWLKANAMPAAGNLDAISARLKDARIVAMGEATHGTSEFHVVKRRTFQMLVERLGFTVFAIESSWAHSFAIDDFIHGRTDDLQESLTGHYSWWRTEEFADLLRWMRGYNLDPAHPRKLKFTGFDIRGVGLLRDSVLAYLDRVDRPRSAEVARLLPDGEFETPSYQNLGAEAHRRVTEGLADLLRAFDERKAEYLRKTNEADWEIARHSVVVLQQTNAKATLPAMEGSASRDRAMAENVEWIVDHEPPGTKLMLWAHNGHVADESAPYPSMGSYLRKAYGDAMAICGFVFGEGSFRAIPGETGVARTFTVGPPPRGSLDATLSAVGATLFAVDLRTATGNIAEWLSAPHISRQIGGEYSEKTAPIYVHAINARPSYDLLIFVAKTSGTRPL